MAAVERILNPTEPKPLEQTLSNEEISQTARDVLTQMRNYAWARSNPSPVPSFDETATIEKNAKLQVQLKEDTVSIKKWNDVSDNKPELIFVDPNYFSHYSPTFAKDGTGYYTVHSNQKSIERIQSLLQQFITTKQKKS